ncbi:MAG: hypothetical protein OEY30_02350 [Candidatus Bathyarchaeota archaeon]|nr:hypothetical protein [Candidatus Bathyarchaeota archaeon]
MSSNYGSLIRMAAFAIAFVIIMSVVSNMIINPPPTVKVTECSLTSSTVSSGGQTPIKITLKSNDNEDSHVIRVEFSSHQLVRFLLGSAELHREGSIWYYTLTLNPRATLTEMINVNPTLESGISELKYRICVIFYRDGEEFYTKNLDLLVKAP